jgi:hypothetical protein
MQLGPFPFLSTSKCPVYSSPVLEKLEDDQIVAFKSNATCSTTAYSAQCIQNLTDRVTNQPVQMSCLVPTKVYQASWFSLIAETSPCSDIIFATEKTTKALFAKRIFVMFASPGHLKFLKSLGFKTFDTIFDETYDTILNAEKRYDAAFQQVMFLAEADPVELYRKAMPILDHNSALMSSLPNVALNNLQQFLKPHLDKLR